MSKPLFVENSDSEGEAQFETNKDYAKSYNKFRQKELLQKLKDRDGDRDDDSSSDSDSSVDDGAAFNPKFDKEFYKTLASLKQKDPKIYDKNVNFFETVDIAHGDGTIPKKSKTLTVKEYEHKMLMEKNGIFDEDDNQAEDQRPQSPTYNEEQKLLKNEFRNALQDNSDDEGGADFGGLFKKRELTKDEREKQNAEAEKDDEQKVELQNLWSNPKLSKDEKFLRDYILSNGYNDKHDDEIPTYDEIVADSDNDDFESKQSEFEQKYNFRFEEPDQEFIKRYPRTVDHSVRKTDDRRKVKRIEVRDRKEQEKMEKFKEIEILKDLKRKEIEEKIEKLKAVTGDEDFCLGDIDLDADFDPEEHDKKMQNIFNKEYYEVDEGEEKPECPSDIEDLIVENYDEYEPENHDEDQSAALNDGQDFNMDCDYDVAAQQRSKKSLQEELIESTFDRRKRRKRKSKFMEMLETKRPAFNPEIEKSYGQYLDEYYKIDCEDIIGDVKCRFKYVETVPNNFGLTTEEILLAKNKELNQWASLKKATQIRSEHVERNEQIMFKRKACNEALKKKILCSLYEEPSEDEVEVETINNPVVAPCDTKSEANPSEGKKRKKKKKKKNTDTTDKSFDNAVENKLVDVKGASAVDYNKIIIKSTNSKSNAKTSPDQSITHTIVSQDKQPQNENTRKFAKAKGNNSRNKSSNQKLDKAPINTTGKNLKRATGSKTNGPSDERLKAFGINPKKFHKKLKYNSGGNNQK